MIKLKRKPVKQRISHKMELVDDVVSAHLFIYTNDNLVAYKYPFLRIIYFLHNSNLTNNES